MITKGDGNASTANSAASVAFGLHTDACIQESAAREMHL